MTVRGMKLGFWIFFSLCLVSCGLDNRGSDTDGGTTTVNSAAQRAVSLRAFTDNVHPIIAANCGSCHGGAQQPTFALSSAENAYGIVETNALVSMADPNSSRLVIKAGSPHGGCSNCNTTTSNLLRDSIGVWAEAVRAVATPTPTPTTPVGPARVVTISQNIGTVTANMPLAFPLDSLGFAGAVIRVRISRFGSPTPTDFIVERIQLETPASTAISLEDLLPVVNGAVKANAAALRSIKTVVRASKLVTVTSDSLILGTGTLSTLAFSIGKVAAVAPRTCTTGAAFTTNVQPIITQRCQGCHVTAGGSGLSALNLSANPCDSFLERGVPGAFTKSSTIAMPRLQLLGHPATTLTDVQAAAINTWYQGAIQ